MKVKVDTRINEQDRKRVEAIAEYQYGGNFSMALRTVIENGLNIKVGLDGDDFVQDKKTCHAKLKDGFWVGKLERR